MTDPARHVQRNSHLDQQLRATGRQSVASAATRTAFGEALADASSTRRTQARQEVRQLPGSGLDKPVAYQHRGTWYSEDTAGTITKLDAAPAPGTVDVVKDRMGVFSDGNGGYVFRNTLGVVANAKGFDPQQAGYFKADGNWAFRNAWGNVATTARDGGAITPPKGARMIDLG